MFFGWLFEKVVADLLASSIHEIVYCAAEHFGKSECCAGSGLTASFNACDIHA